MEVYIDEALRYLGAGRQAPDSLRQEVAAVMEELSVWLRPRFTYQVFPLLHQEAGIHVSGTALTLKGNTAERMLAQCDRVVLLACTIGVRFDALVRTEQARDMARAVILDACGSALVERGCDEAEREIAARVSNQFLTDRFSPGYGDLPLTLQPLICAVLDAQRRVGIHVGDSMLMNPGKSVTALIGLSDKPQMARIRGCGHCSMRETCTLRKGGNRCAL